MVRIDWDAMFNVGIKKLDAQHRELIRFMNEVYARLDTSVNVGDYSDFFEKLKQHADEHFATEEEYFEKTGYKDAVAHRKQHDMIKARLRVLEDQFNAEPSTTKVFETLQFLDDWLFKHMMMSDKKYEKHFKEHGLS